MARPRAQSLAELPKEPHSVSLKVLRLSRPSLAQQHPLPHDTAKISPLASLTYPSSASDRDFILGSNLILPPAFGSAHVGETFSCSLCANNELPEGTTSRTISGIRIVAEMQTPSQTIPLQPQSLTAEDQEMSSPPLSSIQKIIRFELKEEGNHVLAVNVHYTETKQGDGLQATSGKLRTFRKLYQFLAQPCLSVRTKASELPSVEVDDKTFGPYGKTKLLRYALEAQLENVGEGSIILEETMLEARPPFRSTSLNWDLVPSGDADMERPTLNSRDVLQVAFLIEQEQGVTEGLDILRKDLKRDGRAVLGQLSIEWRGPMGDRGFLSTGNLLTRRK